MNRDEHNCDCSADSEWSAKHLHPRNSIPKLFLMTDSFKTGGSERQFVALAQSLNPAAFHIQLGCIQRHGAFLADLGRVPEFPLGGSLFGLHSLWTRLRLAHHLRRNRVAVGLSKLMARTIIRNPIARFDAPASCERAFRIAELRAMAARAGLGRFTIYRHRFFRMAMAGHK